MAQSDESKGLFGTSQLPQGSGEPEGITLIGQRTSETEPLDTSVHYQKPDVEL